MGSCRIAPSLEAEDAWFERGLLDEFCHIAERVGFHRSNFLCRIDVDEDGDSIAHNEYCEPLCLLGSILARSLPAILLYALLLPVHSIRLYQMLELIKKVRAAAGADLSMNWLRPYMKKRRHRAGDILFRKGDSATEMFLVGKGRYRVIELNIELQPGQIFGELALLTPGYQRTQTVESSKAATC